MYLNCFFPDPPSRPSFPEVCGLDHLAFKVENIEEPIEYLNANGVATEAVRIDPYRDQNSLFFQIPMGFP